ncbi:MAG: CRISPR-associated helicase Cas3' [Veillonellaceae bacterium]|nr:CRISPR-associated helicase Cas3' [Veillonellaceae bacterium]
MEQKLLSSDLFSHPNKLLQDHLSGVAKLSQTFSNEKTIKLIDKNLLIDISHIITLSHDLGKSTNYFQEYLFFTEEQKLKYQNKNKSHHSLLSAVCGYFLVKEYLNIKNIDDWFLPFIAFLVIKRHHTNIDDIINETNISENELAILNEQIENINADKLKNLGNHINQRIDKNNIKNWVGKIKEELKDIRKKLRVENQKNDIKKYLMINLFYSILLDADKSDVVIDGKKVFSRVENITDNLVDKFKEQKNWGKSYINNLREEAYREVINNEVDLSRRVYSLNLPTGLGKTLISFSFALKLRNILYTKEKFIPRIIYSLPFLSIIDQNYSVFEDILNTNQVKIDSNILLKHHHLSEIFYHQNNIEMESDSAKILIEGWNSEIIVTTFIQLFHTLISNKNRSLRKFHRLANSIIILDEIQSIPYKYWLLCKEILKTIAEEFNSYIIFVTATEPLIFKRDEVCQLSDRNKYFSKLDRLTITPKLENDLTIEEFAETIEIDENKKFLFIFNTIENSAKKFYKLLTKNVNKKEITYLSTHIVPKERLKRIQDIKQCKYKIVVSTQLVEAGVDIDFDVVYRDIAPLDSINQSAGRCNRNNRNPGKVFIVSLKDDNGKRFAQYIYDPVLLNITSKLLKKYETIKEKDFLNLIDEYYKETTEKMSSDSSREILEAIYKLKYDSTDETQSIEHFNLIEQDYPRIDVFVELDSEAKNIWEQYKQIKNIKDIFERKKSFDHIKPLFYQYVISISQKCKNIPPEVEGFMYVPQNCLEDYYDIETGYITKSSGIIW